MQRNKFYPLLLSLLSGILLCFGWPVSGSAWLLFIAFVPLLILEEICYKESGYSARLKVLGYSFISFLLWNTGTTWWIYNSTSWGAIAAFVFNALFMATVFWLFHVFRKKWKSDFSYLLLPASWISFEFLHLNWDLSWPWLTLGNGFASSYTWVQWYQYTGVLGGSLWILAVNILVFFFIKQNASGSLKGLLNKRILLSLSVVLIPILFSFFQYKTFSEKQNPVSVVVVQPNIDPYNEKFNDSSEEQIKKFLDLAAQAIDSNTDYLIGPETALPEGIWEDDITADPNIISFKKLLSSYPRLKIICGISSQKAFRPGEPHSLTARKFRDGDNYYESYNTAIQLDASDSIQFYHKSRLVPGVEKMPYPRVFGFLENFAIDLGGTSGSLGTQETRTVFTSDKAHAAPVICYESVYGDFISGYIRNGADFIAIITNDGWWGNTPGYRQHLQIGRLRAIEMRRSIARSANTGVSCFISQNGDISQATSYWTPAVIKGKINLNKEKTFYSRYGDLIGYLSVFIFLLSVLYSVFMSYRKSKSIH